MSVCVSRIGWINTCAVENEIHSKSLSPLCFYNTKQSTHKKTSKWSYSNTNDVEHKYVYIWINLMVWPQACVWFLYTLFSVSVCWRAGAWCGSYRFYSTTKKTSHARRLCRYIYVGLLCNTLWHLICNWFGPNGCSHDVASRTERTAEHLYYILFGGVSCNHSPEWMSLCGASVFLRVMRLLSDCLIKIERNRDETLCVYPAPYELLVYCIASKN